MNKFTGLIPSELGNLGNLQDLNLSDNNLEGPLPSQMSNCTKMISFDVGFNFLNGSFPPSFRSWTRLSMLILRENHFAGGIPDFISEFEKLSELQLGGNLFGGEIPESMGQLKNLIYGLNLSSNGLTGGIPSELGMLQKLQRLDLSFNNLTGSIEVLGKLSSLIEVNISYNSFDGAVPDTLVTLLNSSPSSFLGNPDLCVSCSSSGGSSCTENSNLKLCDTNSANQKGLSKVKIAMIALGSSLFAVFLLLGLVYVILFVRRSKQDLEMLPNQVSSSLLDKVMKATDNLDDQHIVGRGAHGVVYKAVVGPDDVLAVKKLEFAGDLGPSLSMTREIETIGRIRHRNLVRFRDFWLKGDYGLISYNYMQSGSLYDILHEMYPPPPLEWRVRYKIALGISHGLAYLHYDCDPVILHQDIKPQNILLDSDMEPHIADFGIAKLLEQSSTSTLTTLIPGTVGYIAPESAFTPFRSRKADVYSYGVVLLEIITRKKVLDSSFLEGTDIVGWVQSVWERTGEIDRIVDSSFAEEFSNAEVKKQATQVLLVALSCAEKDPNMRPTMRDVIKLLLKATKRSGS
ncbi:hypothetical protein L6164_018316 [Bauhinia variegata]|uniref:Uncharacterized protein n=1 Tax=Bauhinia variegata TaxID=167791 RepID=A0ACB9NAV4_BAUVA|nr:hypothetical protein L6164_018316 [Bauhinia variegata]